MPASADLAWLDDAVATGEVDRYGPARSKIFAEVGADRNGPVAQRLLTHAADPAPAVRLTVLKLLTDLCPRAAPWPAVADAAASAATDPDERVRRAAAWLFVAAAGADSALRALSGLVDPVGRVALAEALWWEVPQRADREEIVGRMRRDDVAAVRLLAASAALLTAEPHDWPVLDEAVRAELASAAEALGGDGGRISWRAGERWAIALRRRDREQDAYALVERLVRAGGDESARWAGLDIAAEAVRTWRAAPSRLVPPLVAVLAEPASAVRTAAATVVCASLTATRLAADQLARVLVEPPLSALAATALGCVGEHRAVPELLRLLRGADQPPRLGDALAAVAPTLPDPTALIVAARQVLARHQDPCPGERHRCPAIAAVRCLLALGPAAADAAPELNGRLAGAVRRGAPADAWLEICALGRIGTAAGCAVPLLRHLAATDDPTADHAVRALLTITGDRRVADDYLDSRPEQLRRCRIGPDLVDWLTRNGGLTDRQARQLDQLFAQEGRMQAGVALAYWRHHGPPAAPALLRALPKYLDDDAFAAPAAEALAAMGPYARPVIPELDRLIDSPRRAAVYLGDVDAELRADERLLQVARTARARIAGALS